MNSAQRSDPTLLTNKIKNINPVITFIVNKAFIHMCNLIITVGRASDPPNY